MEFISVHAFSFPVSTLRPPDHSNLRGESKATRDLGRNPVCPWGHMLYRVEIVSYSLEVYSRNNQRFNCNSLWRAVSVSC